MCCIQSVRCTLTCIGQRASGRVIICSSWANPHKGKPHHHKAVLIPLGGGSDCFQGLQPPVGLRAHSTRGLAASWALFRGVSVQDICAAASWSLPLTFDRFYMLDVSTPCVAHAVLLS